MINPQAVYIQLTTECNGFCSICPQPKALEKFGVQQMPRVLFEKIISDLEEHEYRGIIGLFLQYEPLLDDRVFDFIEIAKKGKAVVEISTNGILIKENMEKLKASSVDRIYFNYGGIKYGTTDQSVIDDVNELAKGANVFINYPMLEVDIVSDLFPGCHVDHSWASNRGGNIDIPNHNQNTKFASRNCQQLNIVSNGDIILCCNDYMRENIFGNAGEENAVDVWREIPKHFDYPICKRCV